jgi:large subunit ribosomal protein L6
MSRIGKKPVEIPAGVTITLDGSHIKVKGPKGELERTLHANMTVAQEDKQIVVTRPNDQKENRALHGLTRALIQNMVTGVTEGYKKTLQLVGVGYKAEMRGKALELAVGYSHPVLFGAAEGITISVLPKENKVIVEGIDKQAVGEAAVRIRRVRPPEPYKGKGIKYEDEIIKRKAGKTAGA